MSTPTQYPAAGALAASPWEPACRTLLAVAAAVALLGGCASRPSGPPPPASTGAAGGGSAVGADASLQTCLGPVGTVRLQDALAEADTASSETASNPTIQSVVVLLKQINSMAPKDKPMAGANVSIDALRLLIQQSNCLVIVDRGTSESAASDEKRRTRSHNSEVRDSANMGSGQEVAADFVLRAQVLDLGATESSGFSLGAFIPFKALGGASGSQQVTAAKVQLVLSDVRAKIQLAVAQGEGSGKNTGIASSVLSRIPAGLGSGKLNSESKTSPSAVVLQAYADAYNKLVPALRGYKSQSVQGGLGAGGTLGVQGAAGATK